MDHPVPALRARGLNVLQGLVRAEVPSKTEDAVAQNWYSEMLSKLLIVIPAEPVAQARATALSLLSDLCTAATWPSMRAQVVDMVIACQNDSSAAVRSATAQVCSNLIERELDGPVADTFMFADTILAMTADPALDVRSAAVTAVANIVASYVEGSNQAPPPLQVGATSVWHGVSEAVLYMCKDKEKVRGAAYRAVGYLLQAIDFTVVEPAIEAPPGLDMQAGSIALLPRFGSALVEGAQTPPVKCQWNACCAMGQLYLNPTFFMSPHWQDLHGMLQPSLLQAASATNLKVRIQAVKALTQWPSDSRLWELKAADIPLEAICDALTSPDKGATPAEERQRATYLKSLRTEICVLAALWEKCAPPNSPGPQVRKKLDDVKVELGSLLLASEKPLTGRLDELLELQRPTDIGDDESAWNGR
eukprot:gnl/MRDRNA2_/MRDRNA2_174418_c0_seq1.p1 gnl/MRDRNA2_/MRDRNA2_174418_c0~~gnl/MRDRNA2_/MRDRNA2_174418_c0_seq1.p1  ORF type:complete len:427 (+),score=88.73 gnl/MRDRNA2_/MRDRNA2_174418_c0_seq1:26-1282(+)